MTPLTRFSSPFALFQPPPRGGVMPFDASVDGMTEGVFVGISVPPWLRVGAGKPPSPFLLVAAWNAPFSLPPSLREVPRRGGRSHLILGAFLRVSKCFLANSPVGLWPPANLETAYYPCRFRAPAQMRSRCVGRGDASRAVKPRGTQRRTCWLCRERGLYRARRWRGIRSLLRCRDGGSICRSKR